MPSLFFENQRDGILRVMRIPIRIIINPRFGNRGTRLFQILIQPVKENPLPENSVLRL